MPKQIINTKMNMQNIIILSVFIIGCFILYRMISTVQQQLLVLKKEVINMKLQSEEQINNNTINSFCAIAKDKDDDDDVVSVNSEKINNIMSKLNGSSDSLQSSVVAQDIIDSIIADEPSVNQEEAISKIVTQDIVPEDTVDDDNKMHDKNEGIDDDIKIIDDDIKIIKTPEKTNFTESDLATKQLPELKNILKSITGKTVKGNKNEIIQKILESK